LLQIKVHVAKKGTQYPSNRCSCAVIKELTMKTQFGMTMLVLALMCAMASGTFAQTRNGAQNGASSSGESNSQKDTPSSAGGTGGKAHSDKMNSGGNPK
jgi:hypothetical protein